ncbi:antibiotic biosynthesis monooxygenase [Methylotenera sp.]|uniref:antibiotic biosynthesis monooxygenase n=1 Tax=Methylotenera sp. TaxID=2051956 RepID=UPI002729255A|nr:antibiotic biosynthesis monooxygenase [Methylotenera sp.]MDO9206236.1 antibiotic biosynthesis monooxygenase [Methylotenera sp.]
MTKTSPLDTDQTATVVISHHVKDNAKNNYESWLKEIIPVSKGYPGHLGVGIVHPVLGATVTYTVIIRFDTRKNLLNWMQSADRKKLIEKVQPYLVEDDLFYVRSGLDFWFTPEEAKARLPTKWKQFLITWFAIFPLVLTISAIADWLTTTIPINPSHELKVLSITFFVVLMMVYVVIPRYTKLVHQWLFS